MGARPLGRVIQSIRSRWPELLFGRLTKGGVVHVSLRDSALALDVEGPEHPRLPKPSRRC